MPHHLAAVRWTSPPLFNLRASRRELLARFGPLDVTDLDSNGIGPFDAWLLRFDCGLEVAVWLFHWDGSAMPIVGDEALRLAEVHANDREFQHLAFHLLGVGDVTIDRWVPDPTHVGRPQWRVARQDDHGHEFVVGSFTSSCEAEAVAATFTRRGHKQFYWVEPIERPRSGSRTG